MCLDPHADIKIGQLEKENFALAFKLGELRDQNKSLEMDLGIANACARGGTDKMKCGHMELYIWTEDGGKTMLCAVCRFKQLEVQLRAVYVLMVAAGLPDGPGFEAVRSVAMMYVPNELKGGEITPQEFGLLMKTQEKSI